MRFCRLITVLASVVTAVPAVAQPSYTSRCAEIVLDSAGYLRRTTHPVTGAGMTIISQGFIGRCPADRIRLRADSAERHEETGVTLLFGNVQYTEPGRILHSDRLFYYSQTEYITAEGNVRGTMDGGTSMQGPRAEYWRASPALGRPRARFVATGRPRFTVVEAEATGARAEPTRIDADRVFMDGDSLIYASGNVVVDRPDLRTQSDSVFVDRGRDIVNLRGREPPTVEGKGDRRFVLTGSLIDLYSRDRDLERVVSAGAATVVSDDFTITSDTLDMRIVDERLSRAYAWGPSRARAVSPDRMMEADSLDLDMPSGRVRTVFAIGTSIAESAVDTTVIRSEERDWIRGDTITARFDSLAVGDTTSTPRIQSLVARQNARAFYQVASRNSEEIRPAINYVTGRDIDISFDSAGVRQVNVLEQAVGVYLEPGESLPEPGMQQPAGAGPRRVTPPPAGPPRAAPPGGTGAPPRSTATPPSRPVPPR